MGIEICKDLNELHPKVKELALKFLEECKKAGLNILITETYRSVERQDYLYAQGRTRAGNIVTHSVGNTLSSYHQWRLAFDIANNSKSDPYNMTVLTKAGAIGEKLGLEWGGSWANFKDYPHFQYTFGLSIKDLHSGKLLPSYASTSSSEKAVVQENYQLAINELEKKGIITTPSAWENLETVNPTYVQMLIINIAKYILSQLTYEEAIKLLVEKQIVSYPEAWLNQTTYPVQNVKRLITLVAEKL